MGGSAATSCCWIGRIEADEGYGFQVLSEGWGGDLVGNGYGVVLGVIKSSKIDFG